jgi:hypothetical protein
MFPVGRKQPRNQHQNPVQPYIAQAGPRFYDSGKKWTVDVGAVMKQSTENKIGNPTLGGNTPDPLGGAVLSVSRDNQAPYGRRSSWGKWDGSMRLPTINQYHKLKPFSRIPAKATRSIRAPPPHVVPRVSETSTHREPYTTRPRGYTPFTSTPLYKARNNTLFGLEKKLIKTSDQYPSTTNIPPITPLE